MSRAGRTSRSRNGSLRGWVVGSLTLVQLWAAPGFATEEAAYRVVVNPANPVSSLPKSEVSDLFLRKRTRWEHGLAVVPVDQSEVAPVRHAFSKEVHGKSLGGVRVYWQQRIFSGRDLPPTVMSSDQEVLAYVRTNPGAVGYVSAAASVENVRVLKISE